MDRAKAARRRRPRNQKKAYRWWEDKDLYDLWCSAAAHSLHKTPEKLCPRCSGMEKESAAAAAALEVRDGGRRERRALRSGEAEGKVGQERAEQLGEGQRRQSMEERSLAVAAMPCDTGAHAAMLTCAESGGNECEEKRKVAA